MEVMNYEQWAQNDWAYVEFGDQRLNDRAVRIGTDFLRNPFVFPPKMFKTWKNIKAFYRFINSDKVTHGVIISKHTRQSRNNMSNNKIVLAVQDATTITLHRNYEVEGLYNVGTDQGVVVQNTISVVPHENYGIIDGLLK